MPHPHESNISTSIPNFVNHNLTDIVTPINTKVLAALFADSKYDEKETKFIMDGFCNGFSIGYNGPMSRQDRSANIPFTVGDKLNMWEKLMKEVKLGRVAGPFDHIPFADYMQSPIGLVPKDNGRKTRLIFHLSFEFKSGLGSLNGNTPDHLCTMKYRDLDHAIHNCLQLLEEYHIANPDDDTIPTIFFSKTDLTSAYRVLPLRIGDFKWLVMMAENPITGKIVFFVNKCLPFGASISCSHFQ